MKKIFYSIIAIITTIAFTSCKERAEIYDSLMGNYVMTQVGQTTIEGLNMPKLKLIAPVDSTGMATISPAAGKKFRIDGGFVGKGGMSNDNSIYINPEEIHLTIDSLKITLDYQNTYHVYKTTDTTIVFKCTQDGTALYKDSLYTLTGEHRFAFEKVQTSEATE